MLYLVKDCEWFSNYCSNWKKKIMTKFNNTFASSTFWSERSAYVAALKTISIMRKNKTYLTVDKIGKKIKEGWREIGKKTGVKIDIRGPNSFPSFSFKKIMI